VHEAWILEALSAKFHPSVGFDKTDLMALWTATLQYLDDCAARPTQRTLENINCILPFMCKMALNFPQYAGQCLQDVMIQKQAGLRDVPDFPGLDTVSTVVESNQPTVEALVFLYWTMDTNMKAFVENQEGISWSTDKF
jgi:hypothetical protein